MSARCGEPHPDDPESACAASEGPHVQHAARDGRTWPNIPVAEREARRITSARHGAALAREVAATAERPTRAR